MSQLAARYPSAEKEKLLDFYAPVKDLVDLKTPRFRKAIWVRLLPLKAHDSVVTLGGDNSDIDVGALPTSSGYPLTMQITVCRTCAEGFVLYSVTSCLHLSC